MNNNKKLITTKNRICICRNFVLRNVELKKKLFSVLILISFQQETKQKTALSDFYIYIYTRFLNFMDE